MKNDHECTIFPVPVRAGFSIEFNKLRSHFMNAIQNSEPDARMLKIWGRAEVNITQERFIVTAFVHDLPRPSRPELARVTHRDEWLARRLDPNATTSRKLLSGCARKPVFLGKFSGKRQFCPETTSRVS
jgi:hypothetical protein